MVVYVCVWGWGGGGTSTAKEMYNSCVCGGEGGGGGGLVLQKRGIYSYKLSDIIQLRKPHSLIQV